MTRVAAVEGPIVTVEDSPAILRKAMAGFGKHISTTICLDEAQHGCLSCFDILLRAAVAALKGCCSGCC